MKLCLSLRRYTIPVSLIGGTYIVGDVVVRNLARHHVSIVKKRSFVVVTI